MKISGGSYPASFSTSHILGGPFWARTQFRSRFLPYTSRPEYSPCLLILFYWITGLLYFFSFHFKYKTLHCFVAIFIWRQHLTSAYLTLSSKKESVNKASSLAEMFMMKNDSWIVYAPKMVLPKYGLSKRTQGTIHPISSNKIQSLFCNRHWMHYFVRNNL